MSILCLYRLFALATGAEDLGLGVSYLEILILFEQWAGRRLLSEKNTRPHVCAHRTIPGGMGRFVSCTVGA